MNISTLDTMLIYLVIYKPNFYVIIDVKWPLNSVLLLIIYFSCFYVNVKDFKSNVRNSTMHNQMNIIKFQGFEVRTIDKVIDSIIHSLLILFYWE